MPHLHHVSTCLSLWFSLILSQNCNLFDGTDISNTIEIQQNSRISNIEITDPLTISFRFILFNNTDNDCTVSSETRNLIQFGIAESYDDIENPDFDTNRDTDVGVFFPRISTVCKNNTLRWFITILAGNFTVNITKDSFTVPINNQSSFHILFSGNTLRISIGGSIFYNNNNTDNSEQWDTISNESHPFYTSNQLDTPLAGNITQLCIATASASPTNEPTAQPSFIPTVDPTTNPTKTLRPTAAPTKYQKIHCYTESGGNGDLTVQCSQSGYIITSCGITTTTSTTNRIFNKGAYIQRLVTNDLSTDGICHVNYNVNHTDNIDTSTFVPKARCCAFEQQYNEQFKCRYFESDIYYSNFTTEHEIESSFLGAAQKKNEYTYVTCSKEFPILLSCHARVDEQSARINTMSSSNDAIQFYGAYQASTATTNYYFSLNTATNKSIPYPPTTASNSTTTAAPTPVPTYEPTYPKISDTRILNISQSKGSRTQCVAQYGPNNDTGSYTVTAIATCCTQNYTKPQVFNFSEPTAQPTASPTYPRLQTKWYGPNGTVTKNIGDTFYENQNDDSVHNILTGISEWSIIQQYHLFPLSAQDGVERTVIAYQGVLIGSYFTSTPNGTKQIYAAGDYSESSTEFFQVARECSSFVLDTNMNGETDYINGFDIYYTQITVYGITFYTAYGRKYSCPDNEKFVDDSIQYLKDVINRNREYIALDARYYNMTKVSRRNLFAHNSTYGTYKLGGWGWVAQKNMIALGIERKLYAAISFSFVLDKTVNTLEPSLHPSQSPIQVTSATSTLSPTLIGQAKTETLVCYAIFGNKKVSCDSSAVATDAMMGCNGYSVEGQVFNTYIDDESDACIVDTINNKSAAAIGTCCHFYEIPDRKYEVFYITSIIGGVLFLLFFVIVTALLFFIYGKQRHYREMDVDDDTLIDETKTKNDIDEIFDGFRVDEDDINEMLEIQRNVSRSPGLQSD